MDPTYTREEIRVTVAPDSGYYQPIPCKIRQWGDMTGCETPGCGLRWDTGEPDPPRCPRMAVQQARRSAGYYPSTPSPSPDQAGFPWLLLSLLTALAILVGVIVLA